MSAIILDASVAVKLVSEELDSQIALERVAAASRIIAPDWMLIEASHALWKKSTRSSFGKVEAKAGVEALGRIVDKIVPSFALVPKALTLAFEISHPIYDCLYLALGEVEDAVVLTADLKFVEHVRHAGLGDMVDYLGAS